MKLITSLLVVIFSFSSISYSAPGISLPQIPFLPQTSLVLSPEMGSVESVFEPSKVSANTPFVYLIQDAHENLDAQENIREILKKLVRDAGVSLVLFEGGSLEFNPAIYQTGQNCDFDEQVWDSLFKQGAISGVERFSLGENVKALGIEDEKIYFDNIASLAGLFREQDIYQPAVDRFDAALSSIAGRLLSGDLKKLRDINKSFKLGKIDLLRYARRLSGWAHEFARMDFSKVDSQRDWPQIYRLLKLAELEKELSSHQKEIAAELAKVSGSSFVWNVSEHWRVRGRLRWHFEHAIDEMKNRGENPEKYPNLKTWMGFQVLQDEISARSLFEELTRLEKQILDRKSVNPEVKQFLAREHDFSLIRKLVTFELSHEELAEIKTKNIPPDPSFEALYTQALKTYNLVLERDRILAEKAYSAIQTAKSKSIALVAGGFHSHHLEEFLKEKKLNYALVTPAIRDIHHRLNYRERITLVPSSGKTARADQIPPVIVGAVAGGENYKTNFILKKEKATRDLQPVGAGKQFQETSASSLGEESAEEVIKKIAGLEIDLKVNNYSGYIAENIKNNFRDALYLIMTFPLPSGPFAALKRQTENLLERKKAWIVIDRKLTQPFLGDFGEIKGKVLKKIGAFGNAPAGQTGDFVLMMKEKPDHPKEANAYMRFNELISALVSISEVPWEEQTVIHAMLLEAARQSKFPNWEKILAASLGRGNKDEAGPNPEFFSREDASKFGLSASDKFKRRRPQEAESELRGALAEEQYKKDPSVMFSLAKTLFRMSKDTSNHEDKRRLAEAILLVRESNRLAPLAEKLGLESEIFFRLGKPELARDILNQIRSKYSESSTRNTVTKIFLDWGYVEEATQTADETLGGNPGNSHARELLARAYLSQGQPEKALAIIGDGERREDRHYWMDMLRIQIFSILGETQKGLRNADRMLGQNPLDFKLNHLKVNLLLTLGKPEEAIKIVERFLTHDPSSRVMQILLVRSKDLWGRKLLQRGESDQARAQFAAAIKFAKEKGVSAKVFDYVDSNGKPANGNGIKNGFIVQKATGRKVMYRNGVVHSVNRHQMKGLVDPSIFYTSFFPERLKESQIQDLIHKGIEQGVNYQNVLPSWEKDTFLYIVPEAERETLGVSVLWLVIRDSGDGTAYLATAYPVSGRSVPVVSFGERRSAARANVLGPQNFVLNLSSGTPLFLRWGSQENKSGMEYAFEELKQIALAQKKEFVPSKALSFLIYLARHGKLERKNGHVAVTAELNGAESRFLPEWTQGYWEVSFTLEGDFTDIRKSEKPQVIPAKPSERIPAAALPEKSSEIKPAAPAIKTPLAAARASKKMDIESVIQRANLKGFGIKRLEKLETGEDEPAIEELNALARVYGMTPVEVFTGKTLEAALTEGGILDSQTGRRIHLLALAKGLTLERLIRTVPQAAKYNPNQILKGKIGKDAIAALAQFFGYTVETIKEGKVKALEPEPALVGAAVTAPETPVQEIPAMRAPEFPFISSFPDFPVEEGSPEYVLARIEPGRDEFEIHEEALDRYLEDAVYSKADFRRFMDELHHYTVSNVRGGKRKDKNIPESPFFGKADFEIVANQKKPAVLEKNGEGKITVRIAVDLAVEPWLSSLVLFEMLNYETMAQENEPFWFRYHAFHATMHSILRVAPENRVKLTAMLDKICPGRFNDILEWAWSQPDVKPLPVEELYTHMMAKFRSAHPELAAHISALEALPVAARKEKLFEVNQKVREKVMKRTAEQILEWSAKENFGTLLYDLIKAHEPVFIPRLMLFILTQPAFNGVLRSLLRKLDANYLVEALSFVYLLVEAEGKNQKELWSSMAEAVKRAKNKKIAGTWKTEGDEILKAAVNDVLREKMEPRPFGSSLGAKPEESIKLEREDEVKADSLGRSFRVDYGNSLDSVRFVIRASGNSVWTILETYFPGVYDQLLDEVISGNQPAAEKILKSLEGNQTFKEFMSYLTGDESSLVVTGPVEPKSLILQLSGKKTAAVVYFNDSAWKQSFDQAVASLKNKEEIERKVYFADLSENGLTPEKFLEQLFEDKRLHFEKGDMTLSRIASNAGIRNARSHTVWMNNPLVIDQVLARLVAGYGLPLSIDESGNIPKDQKEFYDTIRLSLAAWLSMDPDFLKSKGWVRYENDRYVVTDSFIDSFLKDALIREQAAKLIASMA